PNRREPRPSLCSAKKPSVIWIIGNTHAVRFSAMPRTKRTRSVSGSPLAANVAASLSSDAGAGFFGAAVRGMKFPVEDRRPACPDLPWTGGGACPPPGLALNSPFTVFGGKQTLSLH